jgi:hypothetical protein
MRHGRPLDNVGVSMDNNRLLLLLSRIIHNTKNERSAGWITGHCSVEKTESNGL